MQCCTTKDPSIKEDRRRDIGRSVTPSPVEYIWKTAIGRPLHITAELDSWPKMASFFDIKARKAAAANGALAAKAGEPKQAARKQPWVEK